MTTPAMSGAPPESLATWLAFVTSPAAPKHAMSALELEGYLTGVLVTPSLIPPSRWLAGLWGEDEPVFDDAAQIQSALGAVGRLHNEIGQRIERSLRHLEAEKVCDYRPGFQPQTGKPARNAVITWVRGFWRAMALAPGDWAALIEDERTQVLMVPFVGFMDAIKDEAFEPAPDIEERLDEAAADLPRSILLLRKIAELRASRSDRPTPARGTKVGRNDPCPCGSGKKFKRCCGTA